VRRSITEVVLGLFAAVGGFLVILQLVWFAGFEATWLPYAAQPVGVLFGAIALARMSPSYKATTAFVVGAASVGCLAAISHYAPNVFNFTAAASGSAVYGVPLLSLVCGLSAFLGAWLGVTDGSRSSLAWAAVAAALAVSAAIQIGGRAQQVLDPSATEMELLAGNSIFAFLVGAAVQTVAPRRAIESSALGVAGWMAIAVGALLKRDVHIIPSSIVRTAVPVIVAAVAGSALIWWRSPHRD
jgi:hypothetical protein